MKKNKLALTFGFTLVLIIAGCLYQRWYDRDVAYRKIEGHKIWQNIFGKNPSKGWETNLYYYTRDDVNWTDAEFRIRKHHGWLDRVPE